LAAERKPRIGDLERFPKRSTIEIGWSKSESALDSSVVTFPDGKLVFTFPGNAQGGEGDMTQHTTRKLSFTAIPARRRRAAFACGVLVLAAVATGSKVATADEGGVSFWVPGLFGSLAATPQQPGWTLATIYYHTSVSAGADVAFARQVGPGGIKVPFTGNLSARLDADADLGFVIPGYVFATPVLGGQAAVALLVPFGRNKVSVDATLTGSLGPFGFDISRGRTESVSGFADLAPQASLRWNFGLHNWMTYITGDVPVGSYNSKSIANLGIGHGVVDVGGGYTYFNPQTGHEFSAVLGFSYNLKNPDTQYQNGVDMHLDWGASQFLTKQWQVGLVGYFYNQISCDSGSGDRVGCFESRVIGVGPQIGYVFPIGTEHQGYLNLKGYKEFDAGHRPEGWNAWLTFAISSAAAPPPTQSKRMIVK